MPKTAARFPLVSIECEREAIPVDTMSPAQVPDEQWRHIDKQGHGHFWDGGNLPTLEWVVTGTEWVGDEFDSSEYEVGEYRCLLCGEVAEPKRRSEYGPSFIPGLATFTVSINDESFRLTEDQYADSVEKWAKLLRSATKREP